MLIQPVHQHLGRPVTQTFASPACLSTAKGLTVAASSLLLRGGGAAASASLLDLGRTKLRLESLHQYGVTLSLLMNASLRLFSSTPKKLANDKSLDDKAKLAFVTSVATTVVSSAYAIIIFFLMEVYSKRALGIGNDAGLLNFVEASTGIRESGFAAFLVSLVSFKSSFVLSMFLNYHGKPRWWIAGSVIVVDLIGWVVWARVATLAKQLLFSAALN